mmetsp:Transcript_29283/g.58568  ORF Transcript_29283/g.58568 Transcript_29283/m.58568 type:complete len:104 (-) Transcript_29283:234-545(-)
MGCNASKKTNSPVDEIHIKPWFANSTTFAESDAKSLVEDEAEDAVSLLNRFKSSLLRPISVRSNPIQQCTYGDYDDESLGFLGCFLHLKAVFSQNSISERSKD